MGGFKIGEKFQYSFQTNFDDTSAVQIITKLGNTCEDRIFQSSERCNNLLYRQFQIMFIKCLFPPLSYTPFPLRYVYSYNISFIIRQVFSLGLIHCL